MGPVGVFVTGVRVFLFLTIGRETNVHILFGFFFHLTYSNAIYVFIGRIATKSERAVNNVPGRNRARTFKFIAGDNNRRLWVELKQ